MAHDPNAPQAVEREAPEASEPQAPESAAEGAEPQARESAAEGAEPQAPETAADEAVAQRPEAAAKKAVAQARETAAEKDVAQARESAAEGAEPQAPASAADEVEPQARQASAEAPEPEDHEHRVEADLDELAAKAEKADEYLELAQRTKADFENYRRRAMREAAAAQERGIAKLAKELLPAVDNLDRALQNAQEDGGGPLADGIKLVHADVLAALARVGIEPFSDEGEPFDPQRHEAVAHQPVEGAEPGTVVEVYQRGYRQGEQVLRPARVLVAA